MNDYEYAAYADSWRQQAKRDVEAGESTIAALLFPICFPEIAAEDSASAELDRYREFIEE